MTHHINVWNPISHTLKRVATQCLHFGPCASSKTPRSMELVSNTHASLQHKILTLQKSMVVTSWLMSSSKLSWENISNTESMSLACAKDTIKCLKYSNRLCTCKQSLFKKNQNGVKKYIYQSKICKIHNVQWYIVVSKYYSLFNHDHIYLDLEFTTKGTCT